jgi:hypothetical protein
MGGGTQAVTGRPAAEAIEAGSPPVQQPAAQPVAEPVQRTDPGA